MPRAPKSGGSWPLRKQIGAWSRSSTDGEVGVDDLPGQQVLPVAGDDADEVADVVAVVVPVVAGAVAELVDEHRGAALGEEQQGEAGGDGRAVLAGVAAGPLADELVLCRGPAPRRPRRYQSWLPKKRWPLSRPARSRP